MLNNTRETKMNRYKIELDTNSLSLDNILEGYGTTDIDALTMTVKATDIETAKQTYIDYIYTWDNIIIYDHELVSTLMN